MGSIHIDRFLDFYIMFCRSLFVLFFWPLD